jgi:glycine/D-amino acid oxidase-like deaminating enzyme
MRIDPSDAHPLSAPCAVRRARWGGGRENGRVTPASFWLQQLPEPIRRPPLPGLRSVDVCIVGAGFTGLWTAYELRRAAPELDVVVLEAEHAGFGASGRNGGWVLGALEGSRAGWAAKGGGRDAVLALERAIRDTVDEVGAVVAREAIDCGWAKGGSLHVARSALELERLRAHLADDRAWGVEAPDSVLLDRDEAAARVRVADVQGAHFTPHCARVQPGALVQGLARAAERAGATIHEGTRVTEIAPGVARTAAGDVRARIVVQATEGYTPGLAGRRRALLPMGSSMIATEVLGDATWAQLGWAQAETLLDGRRLYAYLQRTADGRIAIGGRGVPYRYGSDFEREGPVEASTVAELRARLVELFPPLRDTAVAASWQGVLGVPRDWHPAVGLDRASGLAWAGGYAGEGVAAANLAGRTLADLIAGRDSALTRLAWVGPFGRSWEPEPLRFTGVRVVHGLMEAADRREAGTGRPSRLARAAELLSGRPG